MSRVNHHSQIIGYTLYGVFGGGKRTKCLWRAVTTGSHQGWSWHKEIGFRLCSDEIFRLSSLVQGSISQGEDYSVRESLWWRVFLVTNKEAGMIQKGPGSHWIDEWMCMYTCIYHIIPNKPAGHVGKDRVC